jgi:uncharacterized protein (DUF952 family)
VTSDEPTPVVYHLATPDEWGRAREQARLEPASLEQEGFVHCSTEEQLIGTIERHFGGVDELVLLRLETAALGDDLRWEESRPGEVYPHVYRPLVLDDVVDIVRWRRGVTDLPG